MDGSQHVQSDHVKKDTCRDEYLASLGLKVLRFNSREVMKESDAVLAEIPPHPPLKKGGITGKKL